MRCFVRHADSQPRLPASVAGRPLAEARRLPVFRSPEWPFFRLATTVCTAPTSGWADRRFMAGVRLASQPRSPAVLLKLQDDRPSSSADLEAVRRARREVVDPPPRIRVVLGHGWSRVRRRRRPKRRGETWLSESGQAPLVGGDESGFSAATAANRARRRRSSRSPRRPPSQPAAVRVRPCAGPRRRTTMRDSRSACRRATRSGDQGANRGY
jgi:hypothetical protein